MQTEERMCRHSQQQRNSNDDMQLSAGKISNSKKQKCRLHACDKNVNKNSSNRNISLNRSYPRDKSANE